MSKVKALDELREIAADINASEIVDHMKLYPSCVFDGAWLDAWHDEFYRAVDRLESEIAERYMELPVDADGVPIRCGDVVDGGMGDSGKVQHVELWPDGFVVVYECHPGTFTRYAPDAVRHVKPRTVEDVLNDCADEISEKRGIAPELNRDTPTRNEIVDKYADEIRELLGVDA